MNNVIRQTSNIVKLILFGLIFLTACNEEDSPEHDKDDSKDEEHVGAVRSIGTPLGGVEDFTVSPSGGTIVHSSGIVEISFPEGALQEETTIGIQQIENTAPNGVSHSYRLTPHGIQFPKPVTLTFNYAGDSVSFPNGLRVAYHGEDNVWHVDGRTEIDTSNNRVSIQSTHFSDYSLFESMSLKPAEALIEPDDHIQLKAVRVLPLDLLEPLTQTPAVLSETIPMEQEYIVGWTLHGAGALTPSGNTATYKAPPSVPRMNPVIVVLEVRAESGNRSYLVSEITIRGNEITLNGGPYSNMTTKDPIDGYAIYVPSENITTIAFAAMDPNNTPISVAIFFPGNAPGSVNWNEMYHVSSTHNVGGGVPTIIQGMAAIPGDPPTTHQGYIRVKEYTEKKVSGDFAGNFTFMDGSCQPPCIKYGTVQGTFVVPRFQ